ncbi:molybdopterin molybdotransferase MoeA [Mangrovibrevibacter kandeliae]|uniref:molybdopterin molybdotransferase MoeA n=1 Tax=Mangrovibrevibacter kandeliae TaxID=2968473 RepID=UPI002117CC92|nr:gephyrin-like molybdotransferase Glp [Aurantimonas sp. CSK15Z-1]MCQ8782583.1 molybdopterin molybdotransferase MoeA [Aurantimonas sp. CSK15Z-1]
MITVEEAFARIVGTTGAVAGSESLPLAAALGRILAQDLTATRTQPAFDASAMDGYAVRAADTAPGLPPLRLIGESAAGRAYEGHLEAGETVRIFTGAPVPAGADAVLIQENAERGADETVRPTEPVEAGRHIRRAGNDFSEGDVLLPAGTMLTPGAIALAASGGHPALAALRRPRVAILATGDELVLPGEPVGPSQIVASNTFGVAAMVTAAGGEPLDYGIAADDTADIGARVDRAVAEGVDILVTIGGASVGDHDLAGTVFAEKGVSLDFWKVAMRPGKPLMAGQLGAMRVLGLPGNPASSMVTATLFLAPLVRALAGRPTVSAERAGALGAAVPANDHRADYVRATLSDDGHRVVVTPLPRQDSSLLSIYARADALLIRPPHAPAGEAGEPCSFVPLDG